MSDPADTGTSREGDPYAEIAALREELQRKDAAVAARAWKCIDGWLRCNVGAKSFMRPPDKRWALETILDAGEVVQLMTGNINYTELDGPERDAILAECRKAMGI